jgi:hypothetical protein
MAGAAAGAGSLWTDETEVSDALDGDGDRCVPSSALASIVSAPIGETAGLGNRSA